MTRRVTERGFDRMKKLNLWRLFAPLALVVALLAAAMPAMAQDTSQEISPEQLALARKYVDLTNKGQIYEVILVQTAQKTSKLFGQQNPDKQKQINDVIGKILETYKGKHDDLFNQFARVYATIFTMDDLNQMVAFYSTPTGQKLASTALDVNQSIQKIMQVYTYNLGTEFVTKVKAELQAEGITK